MESNTNLKKPNLFIIGAPKCGTTSMAYYLSQHPKVFVSPNKEPHYFNFDSKGRLSFSEEQYLQNFRSASNRHKYLVDASVWYLYSTVAVDEILKYNPASKFIVMLRNPVDMFYSLHQQLLYNGEENISSPLKAWNIQHERKKGLNLPFGCRDERFLFYKDACSLGKQVDRLLSKVPKEKVRFVRLEDLKKNPKQEFEKILNFLEVDLITLPQFKVMNEQKEKRFSWLSIFFHFINKVKRKLNTKKGFGLANYLKRKNVKKPSDKYKEEFISMKPMLQEAFKDDIALLETLINVKSKIGITAK
jgi:hypothetical protein